MWTIIWLAICTFVGFEIGIYNEYYPLFAAGIGFVTGGVLQLMSLSGGSGASGVFDALGDIDFSD